MKTTSVFNATKALQSQYGDFKKLNFKKKGILMRRHDKMLRTKRRYKATEHMIKTALIQRIVGYFIFSVWFTFYKQAYPSWIK